MNRPLAAALAFIVALSSVLFVVLFLLDDDTPNCNKATTTAPNGTGTLPPGSKSMPMASGTYQLTSPFGPRDGGYHYGQDFGSTAGQPIYAAADGVVWAAGAASGFGQWIVIDSNVDSKTYSTVYGHMFAEDLMVSTGDTVHAGQQIAKVGYNGEVSPSGPGGAHLHFEVWDGLAHRGGTAIDPMPWLQGASEPGAGGGTPTTTGPATPVPSVPQTTTPVSTTTPDASLAGGVAPGTTTPGTETTTAAATTTSPGCGGTQYNGGGDDLQAGSVPQEFEPWLRRAGSICPQIKPSLLAAQIQQESGFQQHGYNSAGAVGYTQFIDSTWKTYGYPVDDQGNPTGPAGSGDRNKVGDAVMAQGHYMCDIAATIDAAIADGRVKTGPAGPEELYLAGYNAGEGAVLSSGGFPTGSPDYEVQTRPYTQIILANEKQYSKTLS